MSGYVLSQIVKTYGQRTVLQLDHLTIAAGQTLALLGPSGAGKSTLLRLLNFLEAPDAGRVIFGGMPVPEGGPSLSVRRTVTTVFQRPMLIDATVAANVAYGLRLRGRYDRHRVELALERVGLAHLAHASARTLSGGEAQRVALARVLVVEPKVLLLDEPTANLDPANVAIIEQIVSDLRRTRTTMVIVTHNLFQARRLADTAALLINGRLVEVGPIEQLFERPQNPETAAFCQGIMVY